MQSRPMSAVKGMKWNTSLTGSRPCGASACIKRSVDQRLHCPQSHKNFQETKKSLAKMFKDTEKSAAGAARTEYCDLEKPAHAAHTEYGEVEMSPDADLKHADLTNSEAYKGDDADGEIPWTWKSRIALVGLAGLYVGKYVQSSPVGRDGDDFDSAKALGCPFISSGPGCHMSPPTSASLWRVLDPCCEHARSGIVGAILRISAKSCGPQICLSSGRRSLPCWHHHRRHSLQLRPGRCWHVH